MTIEVVEFFQSFRNSFLDFFFNFVSFLGEEFVYIGVIGIVYFAINKKLGELLVISIFFAGVFNNVLKNIFHTERPFQAYPNRVVNLRPESSTGHSFPSGHTQMFASFLFTFGWYLKKKYVWILAVILTILMGISRMYLGVHFLEDVVVSMLLGLVSSYFLYLYYMKYKENTKMIVVGASVLALLVVPFLFIYMAEDLYKTFGLLIGFIPAVYLEREKVQFQIPANLQVKIARVLLGLMIMVGVQLGLGVLFDMIANEGSQLLNVLDMIRYGLISFVGLGLYPMMFQKVQWLRG